MKNRSGSYKKILFSEDELSLHKESLQRRMSALLKTKDMGIFDYEFCALYILLFLRIRHPKNWLQKKSNQTVFSSREILNVIPQEFDLSDWEKEKLSGVTFADLFLNYHLKGIPAAILRSLANWGMGTWKIHLLFHIPSSRELLNLQVDGARCVTAITDQEEISKLVLSSRDPLSFVLHDLDHADHFFVNEEIIQGQIGFYKMVKKIYDHPEIKTALKTNRNFRSEFEYVASDMNAYVIHLFKCLKSAFIKHEQEYNIEDSLFNIVLTEWDMNEHEQNASQKLNSPHFDSQDEIVLTQFFNNQAEVISC